MRWPLVLLLACTGCSIGDTSRDREDREALKLVRAAMLVFKAEPGGATARFLDARLVNGATLCGHVDGNDGDGARAVSITGREVTVEQPRDAATAATVAKNCVGPSRKVTSRNAEFTDLGMGD